MTFEPPTGVAGSSPPAGFLAGLRGGVVALGLEEPPVVVGVSGGSDSVALLLGLLRLVPALSGRLVVAHAEHDLRPAAAADREFVVTLAARLGLPCSWRRLQVRADDGRRGEGLEARARRLRYAFLATVARESGARRVAVAHTHDDQAETILHRALRGTGLGGLAGMRPARELGDGIALVRPLLSVSRRAVREFLAAEGQTWREDESNADTARARNLLRQDLLPRSAVHYPAAAAALVRLGRQAGLVAAALASAAEQLLELHARRHADGAVVFRIGGLAGLDPHLCSEVFVALWRREGWPQRDMTAAHYERLVAFAAAGQRAAPGGTGVDLPAGIRGRILPGGWLELRPRQPFISTRL